MFSKASVLYILLFVPRILLSVLTLALLARALTMGLVSFLFSFLPFFFFFFFLFSSLLLYLLFPFFFTQNHFEYIKIILSLLPAEEAGHTWAQLLTHALVVGTICYGYSFKSGNERLNRLFPTDA